MFSAAYFIYTSTHSVRALGNFKNNLTEPLVGPMKYNCGDACNSINRVSGCPRVPKSLEFLELFWIFLSEKL